MSTKRRNDIRRMSDCKYAAQRLQRLIHDHSEAFLPEYLEAFRNAAAILESHADITRMNLEDKQ
jgi:hypothetical protein